MLEYYGIYVMSMRSRNPFIRMRYIKVPSPVTYNVFTIPLLLSTYYVPDWASLVAQMVKCLPTMQETLVRSLGQGDPWRRKRQPAPILLPGKSHGQRSLVRSLGQEDPLEKETATRSSTLAWKIPWTEEPGGLQSMGLQRVGHD